MDPSLQEILSTLGIDSQRFFEEDIRSLSTVRLMSEEHMVACGVHSIGKRLRLQAMCWRAENTISDAYVSSDTTATSRPATRSSTRSAAAARSQLQLSRRADSRSPIESEPTNTTSADVDKSIAVIERVVKERRLEYVRPGSLIQNAGVAGLLKRRFGIIVQDSSVRLSKITEIFAKASDNKELEDLSALTQLNYLNSARALLVQLGRHISVEEACAFRSYVKLLEMRDARDKSSGKSMGWIPFAHSDIRVIMNHALGKRDGDWSALSDSVLQSLTRLVCGYASGRRPTELLLMVPVGMRLQLVDGVRCFNTYYVWSKGKYPGRYEMRWMESETLETDAIPLLLMWCQRRGMIRSALDVYEFRETMHLDPSEWESADRLVSALEALEVSIRDEIAAILATDGEHTSRASSSAFNTMHNISSGRKSFWVRCDSHGRQMEKQLSRKSETLTMLVTAAGYKNDRNNRIGIQSTRKGFRQDARILTTVGLNRSEHLATTMRHSQQIGADVYENGEQYRASVPANIMQVSVNDAAAVRILRDPDLRAGAHTDEKWFSGVANLAPLGTALAALQQPQRRQPVLVCLGANCQHEFNDESTCRSHMASCKTATSWTCSVVVSALGSLGEDSCSKTFARWVSLKSHRHRYHRDTVSCPDCPSTMQNGKLSKHRRSQHPDLWMSEQLAFHMNPERFRCGQCELLSYARADKLAAHIKSKH